jgi:hypothetical protein
MASSIRGWFREAFRVGLTWGAISGAGAVGAAACEENPLEPVPVVQQMDDAFGPVLHGAASDTSLIESLIDDAMQDGAISDDERSLILAQARRHLIPAEVAQVEKWLANQPGEIVTAGLVVAKSDEPKPAAPVDTADPKAPVPACLVRPDCGGLFDNMYYFAAVEGWQGPVDLGFGNGNFGGRVGINLGVPLLESLGIGGQLGVSYGAFNFHGRVNVGGGEDSAIEDHLMMTAGVFRRADLRPCGSRWSWGAAYDLLYADNIGLFSNELFLGQWRFQFGYALSEIDDVGVWTTQGNEEETLAPTPFHVQPLHQYNMYWHHKWCAGADTRGWFGLAEDPGSLVFGTDLHYPLNDCLALIGTAQYILPSARGGEFSPVIQSGFAQEFWNVTIGLAYYPGGNAHSQTVAGRRWMPYFNVADNGSFALEAP